MPAQPTLIYDGECFFCSNYVGLLNLKASVGDILLINARDRAAVSALGLQPAKLNEGMVLLLDGEHYAGADAIHRIALLSTSSTTFNRFNRAAFRRRGLAKLLYPLLKLGRRIYLLLAGKELIR